MTFTINKGTIFIIQKVSRFNEDKRYYNEEKIEGIIFFLILGVYKGG